MPAPANDDFANRILLVGDSGVTTPTTIDDATAEVDEPAGSSGPGTPYQTIWYEWVAPSDGCVAITLNRSDEIDTVLAVWTGNTLLTLVEVASDDDGGADARSQLTFDAVNGTSYKIQCGTYGGSEVGQITLAWTHGPPANDELANDEPLTETTGAAAGATYCSTLDTPYDPSGDVAGTANSVWYRIPLPASWDATSTLHLSFDTAFPAGGWSTLSLMLYSMKTGSTYPPTSLADIDVWGTSGAPDSGSDFTGFARPDDGFVYVGVGDYGEQADFAFAYVIPQPPRIRYADPPLWRLLLTDNDTRVLALFDGKATERNFSFNLDEPWSHTGLVASDDPEINLPFPDFDSPANLTNNMRFIYALRRERGASPKYVCRWSGIVFTLEDVAADTPTTRYTAYDSWQYLFARPIRLGGTTFALPGEDGITYTNARASDIALDLLAATVFEDGTVFIDASDMGLITDTPVIPGDITFPRELSVGEAWQQLCATGTIDIVLRPVFDPLNRPGILSELVIAPAYGTVRHNAVFGWGMATHNIVELSRMVDGTKLANIIRFFLADGTPATTQIDLDSIADFGKYWNQQTITDGDPGEADLVTQLAFQELVMRTRGIRTVEFQPAPEYSPLPLADYGPGDWVPVWADRKLREPLRGYLVNP